MSVELRKTTPAETQSLPPLNLQVLEKIGELIAQFSPERQAALIEIVSEQIQAGYLDVLFGVLENLQERLKAETLNLQTLRELYIHPSFEDSAILAMHVSAQGDQVVATINTSGIIIRRLSEQQTYPILVNNPEIGTEIILQPYDKVEYHRSQPSGEKCDYFIFDPTTVELVPEWLFRRGYGI